ncbi:hypothetical protein [Leptospira interrogans]|uniref:hypothetical protein n=1 Tax=Leptospira interrogans TaxID=173 RepID=UPI0007743592|nr:hypothetical protein [Leptospira interrogans]
MNDVITLYSAFEFPMIASNKENSLEVPPLYLQPIRSHLSSHKYNFQTQEVLTFTSQLSNIFVGIDRISVPDYSYPEIKNNVKEKSKLLIQKISETFRIIPFRVAPSIEGGIAIVYKKKIKKLFFNKKIEIFIEIYNHGNIVMALIENSNLIKVDEIDLNDDPIYSLYFKNLQLNKFSQKIRNK